MNDQDRVKFSGMRNNEVRKIGISKFNEIAEVVSVPISRKARAINYIDTFSKNNQRKFYSGFVFPLLNHKPIATPLFGSKVAAGFPSPADDHIEARLDVSAYLIDQVDATFFATIIGDSMRDSGLLSGDKAVIDRSISATIGDIVLAVVDGEFTIKILGKNKQGLPRLIPANPDYSVIEIKEHMQFEIWGVVTGSFRRFR